MKEGRASLTAVWVAAIRAGAAGLRPPYVRPGGDDAQSGADTEIALLPPPYGDVARRLRAGGNAAFLALEAATRGLASNVVLRTLRIDDVVTEAARGGARQIVLLGAGYDARAHRLPLGDARTFEVDFPSTQAEKRSRVGDAGRRVVYVGVDFERDDLAVTLTRSGLDPAAPSVWVWEGVTMYLSRAARRGTLETVGRLAAPGSTLVLTYSRRDDLGPVTRLGSVVGGRLIGERFVGLTSTEEMHEDVRSVGLSVVEDSDGAAWRARHWPDARPSRLPSWERILVAVRGPGALRDALALACDRDLRPPRARRRVPVLVGRVRLDLPGRVDARVPPHLRRVDDRQRRGARHLHRRARARRLGARRQGRPPRQAAHAVREPRGGHRHRGGAHPAPPRARAEDLPRHRRCHDARRDGRDGASPRPVGRGARRADLLDGRHAPRGRARGAGRRRRGAQARRLPLRREHDGRGRRLGARDLRRDGGVRRQAVAVDRVRVEPPRRHDRAHGRAVGRVRGARSAREGRRRARGRGAGDLRARRRAPRRVRVLPHGARLVPDAGAAPRGLRLHLRAHPRGRAPRHRSRRAHLRARVGQPPGDADRLRDDLAPRSGRHRAPLRARGPHRRRRARAPQPVGLGLLGARRGVGRHRARRRLPRGLRVGGPVPSPHRPARPRKAGVGRHLGLTYAWNTVGAILGSLAGGFGLLPALSATGSWRFVAVALTAVGLAAAGLAVSRKMDVLRAGAAAAIALVVGGLLTADGPTAAWRHSPIGAGRVGLDEVGTPFLARRWLAYQRSKISWQKEGREVTVGLSTVNDRSFIVSGKADGSFRMDVATQVMFPLVGACLHGGPKNAYIIGLGSGSSAGWMADFPGVEHVDVAEIEPAIVDIAGFAKSVNRDVLANKKVHVELLDAREGLLTKKHRYDLIASEPSNPYRAGISSLFTEEYYRAVEQRLAKGGLFLQWMQAYEVDARTIRSIYATLGSVFPHIETWMLDPGDILLVASREPIQKDVAKLRACVEAEPVREAMLRSWDTTTLEGFLSHHVARPSFAEHVKKVHGALPLNTDDLNPLEFGVARTVGRQLFDVVEMQALSTARKERRPEMIGKVDWALVEEEATSYLPRTPPGGFAKPVADRAGRAAAATAAGRRDFAEARSLYQTAGPPVTIHQRLLVAFALAALGDDAALELVAPLAATHEGEIAAIKCRLALTKRDPVVAVAEMKKALASMQASPWFHFRTGQLFVTTIPDVAALARNDAPEIFELLKKKNAGELYEFGRREALTKVAMIAGLDARCRDVAEVWEPNPPWERDVLLLRAHCFEVLHDRRAKAARADADQFVSMESESLDPGAAAAPREAPAERKAPAEQRPAPSP